jgi:hypothetical protein
MYHNDHILNLRKVDEGDQFFQKKRVEVKTRRLVPGFKAPIQVYKDKNSMLNSYQIQNHTYNR